MDIEFALSGELKIWIVDADEHHAQVAFEFNGNPEACSGTYRTLFLKPTENPQQTLLAYAYIAATRDEVYPAWLGTIVLQELEAQTGFVKPNMSLIP